MTFSMFGIIVISKNIRDLFLIYLQSNNPTRGVITPSGIYLGTSLFFVMTTLLEFAVVLFLNRKFGNTKIQPKINTFDSDNININLMEQKPINAGNIEAQNGPITEKMAIGVPLTTTKIVSNNMKSALCTNASLITSIDISMFLVFTTGYVIFNVLYWNVCLSL